MNIVNIAQKAAILLHAQRDRWILWLPVPLAAGIAAYFSLTFEPAWQATALLLIGAALPFLRLRQPAHIFLWLPVFLAVAGFAAAQMRTLSVDTKVLARESYPMVLSGRVTGVEALPKAYRIVLEDLAIVQGWPPRGDMPSRVRIKLKNNDLVQPRAGDRVTVRAVLLPLSGPVLPGAFDFQRHAFFLGLGATGYAIGNVEVQQAADGGFFFEKLRHAIRRHIMEGMADKETAAVTTAFLVGESKAIPEDTWDMIRQSGIAHLLAISGYHITVMMGVFFIGLRALLAAFSYAALHWPIKKISALASVAAAVFYLLLIGSPITAERAVIMGAVVMAAVMFDRDPFSLRLAAFAAIVILLAKPESLMGPSFQMSFAAVVGLIAFYEWISQRWPVRDAARGWAGRASLYILACLVTTVIATAATAPYTLYHFTRMPLLSGLFSNIIAVPVSSLVTLPFGILAIALMPLGLESLPLWIVEKSMQLIMAAAREAASWSHAGYQVDAWPAWLLVLFTLGGMWICIWRGPMRLLGILPVFAAALLIPLTPRPDVMAAPEGSLYAVRDAEGKLWLSSLRREKFIGGEWQAREGGKGAGSWDDPAFEEALPCDALACLWRHEGHVVSFVRQPEAVVADCEEADIFISDTYINRDACPQKKAMIFDRYRLRRDGAHAFYFKDNGEVEVKTVAQARGQRPWMAAPLAPYSSLTQNRKKAPAAAGEGDRGGGDAPAVRRGGNEVRAEDQ